MTERSPGVPDDRTPTGTTKASRLFSVEALELYEPELARIVLHGDRVTRTGVAGPAAALYVMVMADGLTAKVGALEAAANATRRLRDVEMHQQKRRPGPEGYPMRLAVVAELDGLVLGVYDERELTAWEERWAEVVHLEDALRLVLARRLGRFHRWTEWIHIDHPVDVDEWVAHVRRAWGEVDSLGRPADR